MDMPTAPTPPQIGGEINGPGKAYFDHVVTDNIIDALVELSAEVWTTRDRLVILEAVLAERGIDARDAFIAQIFASFMRRTA